MLSEDDFYLGDDSVYDYWTGSGSDTRTITGKFPMNMPAGNYYIFVKCTLSGTDYDPNPVSIDPALSPDIKVSYISLGDSYSLLPGESGTISLEVKNIGLYESGPFEINFYASEDTTITEDDYVAGHVDFSSLDPDAKRKGSLNFHLTDDIPPGDYYIGGMVVCSRESNLENNSFCGDSISVVPPMDLRVEDVSVEPGIYRPGDLINVVVTIENIESMSSGGYTVNYYAANDTATIDLHNSVERDGLEPGEKDMFITSCTFPNNIPQGNYYIKAAITCQDDTQQDNNEGMSESPFWVGPAADLKVQAVDVNGTYLPNDKITVYTLIKNTGDSASEAYTVDYYASTDIYITEQDIHIGYVERDGLEAGEQHSYNTTCQFPLNIPAGVYYIGIIVSNATDYSFSNNTGFGRTQITLVHPPNYVCGRVDYRDINYKYHPVRYARINIYDRNYPNSSLDGRIIGQTYTDLNGTYGTVVINDANSTDQIYLKVFAEGVSGAYPGTTSTICNVKDDILDQTYFSKSNIFSHPRDSSIITDIKMLQSEGAFMVFDSVIEAFHRARNFLVVEPNVVEPNAIEPNAIEPNEIDVYWPCSLNSTFYVPSIGIFVAQDDRSDRDVIMHEYGHYIAEIFNFAQGQVGEDSSHYWDLDLRYNPSFRSDEYAKNLAFREAWATLFSIAIQYGQSNYPNSGDTRYQDYYEAINMTYSIDLERDTNTHNSPGQYYENMNCCALWDIFDDHDDSADNLDTLSDTSLAKIWAVLRDDKPDDIIGFWDSWFKSFQYTDEMTRIFRDHRIEH